MSSTIRTTRKVEKKGESCYSLPVSNKCKLNGGGIIAGGGSNSPRIQNRNIQKNNNSYVFATTANKPQLQNPVPQECMLPSSERVTSATITSAKNPSVNQIQNCGKEECTYPVFEMAGDIQAVNGKRQRKHWTQRERRGADRCCLLVCSNCLDRSASAMSFLKANLAEDGCMDAQLDIAKKLLKESRDTDLLESSQKENSRLAIYWLIKSSEQGNVEATKLLQECFSSGHGITAQNVLDVKTCINTPVNEKITYKAARLLYLKLNNGEKFITTTQLLARISSLNKKNVHFAGESQEQENEDDSLNSAISEDEPASQNIGLNETFTLTRESSNGSSHNKSEEILDLNYLYSNHDGEKLTLENLLKAAGSFNAGESPQPPLNTYNKEKGRHKWRFWGKLNAFVLQLLIFCILSEAVSFKIGVLLATCYLSLWSSFNLLGWKRRYLNFIDWSKAFRSIQQGDQGVWVHKDAEDRLVRNSLFPYLKIAILALVIVLMVDGLGTLKLVSGGLAIYALFSCTTISKFPNTRIAVFVAILNGQTFFNLVGSFISEDLTANTRIIFEDFFNIVIDLLQSLFQDQDLSYASNNLVPIFQIISIAALLLGNRQTILRKHLPELLIALWITKMTEILIEKDILNIGIDLLTSVMLISVVLIIQSNLNFWKMFTSVTIVIAVSVTFITLISESLEENPLRIAISGLRLSPDTITSEGIAHIEKLPLLSWDDYDEACHKKAWINNHNPASTQISCFLKYGKNPTAVKWKGKVSVVKIRKMDQSWLSSIHDVTFEVIVNIMSSPTPQDGSSWQNFLPGSDHVDTPSPAILLVSSTVVLEHLRKASLIELVLGLKSGDKIEFHGVLSPMTLGSLRPEIEVYSLKCLECKIAKEHTEFFIKDMGAKKTAESLSSPNVHHDINKSGETNCTICQQIKAYIVQIFSKIKSNII